MIISLLRFRFRDDVGEPAGQRALAAIARTAAVSVVAFSVIGQNLGDPAEGFTLAYCVGFPDLEALGRDFDEPAHREGHFLFLPLLAKLARVSLSSDATKPTCGCVRIVGREPLDRGQRDRPKRPPRPAFSAQRQASRLAPRGPDHG